MKHFKNKYLIAASIMIASALISCNSNDAIKSNESSGEKDKAGNTQKEYLSQPLVSHIYTADPSAHVFGGRRIQWEAKSPIMV
jgi:hypothetical protein